MVKILFTVTASMQAQQSGRVSPQMVLHQTPPEACCTCTDCDSVCCGGGMQAGTLDDSWDMVRSARFWVSSASLI